MMRKITINSDGGARGNPGPSGAGAVIAENGQPIATVSKYLGERTNNWAEYEALALALEDAFTRFGTESVHVEIDALLDSELVVRQLAGLYKVREPSLATQFEKVKALASHFKAVRYTHIPREKNREADRLANDAMDRGPEAPAA